MRQRSVQDVSELPTYGFGSTSPIWWGTLGFVALFTEMLRHLGIDVFEHRADVVLALFGKDAELL